METKLSNAVNALKIKDPDGLSDFSSDESVQESTQKSLTEPTQSPKIHHPSPPSIVKASDAVNVTGQSYADSTYSPHDSIQLNDAESKRNEDEKQNVSEYSQDESGQNNREIINSAKQSQDMGETPIEIPKKRVLSRGSAASSNNSSASSLDKSPLANLMRTKNDSSSRISSASPKLLEENINNSENLLESNSDGLHRNESLLDNVDVFLTKARPVSHAMAHSPKESMSKKFASPHKNGLLSFHNGDTDSEDDGILNGSQSILESLKERNNSHGIRRSQNETRKLETENMELRLKLQQYREMNASEQEITRARHQLVRSERRIDELEEALERKNETIRELCEMRDSSLHALQGKQSQALYETIAELQAAITQLEEDNNESQIKVQKAISQIHSDLPDIVPENASVTELIKAIRQLNDENSQLTSVASSASSLRAQQVSIKDLLQTAGRPGDPLSSISQLLRDFEQLEEDAAKSRETVMKENHKLKREAENLVDTYASRLQELSDENNKLKTRLTNEELLRRNLEDEVIELGKQVTDARSASYSIIRSFFAEIFEFFGGEFQDAVNVELEDIRNRALQQGISKVPLLTELLLKYTRTLCDAANKAYSNTQDDKQIWQLKHEIESLEHIIGVKWDKAGADAVLRAQIRDLKKQLKLQDEKRKSEWEEYQYAFQQARRAA